MTIIGSFVSPYVRKVLACMHLKGLDYEIDPITPFFGNDEFRRLSPLCRIPVLIDGDFSASDSSVICAYLDEAYPGHPLFPWDPKQRARSRWLEEYADTRGINDRVQALGGTLSVSSHLGGGTRVSCELPTDTIDAMGTVY